MSEKKRDLSPQEDALKHIAARRDKPFLQERFIDSSKRKGVFTCETIKPSMFVVEYRGKIFSRGPSSEKRRDSFKGFLYRFSWKGEQWCLDASNEDKSLGRLVNYDHIRPNCRMRKIVYEGKPHLCLFASKEISPGEEITYSCRDSSDPQRFEDCNPSSSTPKIRKKMKSPCDESSADREEPRPSRGGFRDSLHITELDSSEEMTKKYIQLLEEEFPKKRDLNKNCGPKRKKASSIRDSSQNYCYVCGKGTTKITHHLKSHADEEPDVAEAFSLPEQSAERKRLLDILRNKGNHRHKKEALKTNVGALKVKRRPESKAMTAKRYGSCLYCKGMFKGVDLWRHITSCSKKLSNCGNILDEAAHEVPPDVKKILNSLSQDGIPLMIQNDYLLVQVAKDLTQKFGSDVNKQESIWQKLREMGRFLSELHKKAVFSFEDAIKPSNFISVLSCVKRMVGFNRVTQTYVNQGLALRLRDLLKTIGNIALNDNGSSETTKSNARIFIESCDTAWSRHVPETADLSGGEKASSPSTVLFTRDVQTFYKYLETLSASATESLKSSENPEVYSELSRVTLAKTSILSKSTTDVSKMSLKSFQERDDSTQILSKHFIRINILSKSGQNVAVLLTSQLVSTLTLLISKRLVCGVHKDNPYLFAKPDASPTSHSHGGHCIRSLSGLCHAKNPEHLSLGHHLKHIARIFQILNLENDELEHLAKLLGHNIRSDREYYRSPGAALELAKIAKLLSAMEKGSLGRSEASSLEEVEAGDKPEPDAEQDAVEHIKSGKDRTFLKKKFIDSFKGRGVFTNKQIEASTFVVEFRGNVRRLEDAPEEGRGDALNNFVFDFSWNGTNWRLDASAEDGSLGRLVNDDHINPNCKMKKINYEGKPHLCLFAQKKISPGEEITFSYGNSSYSWRSKVVDSEESSSYSQSSGDEYVCDEEPDSDDSFSESEPQQEASSTRPPEEASSTRPPEEASSTRPPEEASSTRPPEEASSTRPPEEASPTRPPEEASSTRPPEEASSTRPPEEASSTRPPEEASSTRPPEEASSTRPPEEASSTQLSNQIDDPDSDEFETPTHTNKNFCYVCGKSMKKLSRHLFTHRKKEPEIAKAFALRKLSKERKELLKMLVHRGNHKHNQEVLKTRKGCLKARMMSDTLSLEKSAACIYCKVLFSRKMFWKHLQTCPLKVSAPPAGSRSQILALVSTGLTNPKYMSSGVRKILQKLSKEETGCSALKDTYILQLAQCLDFVFKGKSKDVEIKMKLKLMGNLLSALNKKSIVSFGDALKPQNFDGVVEAVKSLAGFNKETAAYKNRLSKLVSCLRKMADIKYAMALNEGADMEMLQEAEEFIKLSVKEWHSSVPIQLTVPCPSTLPFIHDVQSLFKHVNDILTSAIKSLTMYASPPVYTALLKVVVAYVTILNRNVRDVSDVTLESFLKRNETEPQEDSDANRSQFEEILSKCAVKINVADQKGKKLVLVLTPDLLAAVTLLVEKRRTCGVPEDHPFLFAKSGASCSAVLKGLNTLFGFLKHTKVKDLVSIRSSYFRKHTGTIFQILNFSREGFARVATLLGRDIRTEKEFYQKPEAAADVARILVLLSAAETGCLEIFDGKSLEEIEIPDQLQPVVESNRRDEESETSLQVDAASPSSSASKKRKRSSSARSRHKSRKEEESPEEAASKETEPQIYFSDDDDDDVNVEFNVDIDTDGDDEDDGSNRFEANPEDKPEETRDMKPNGPAEEEESKREGDEDARMDVDSDERSEKNNLAAVMKRMKEIKILIPRLNLEKMESPVLISKLNLNNQRPTSQRATSERPTSQRPTSERPTSQRPTSQRPTSERPTSQRPTSQRPTSQRPTSTSERATSERATSERPTSERPTSQQPTSQRPTSERPTSQRPTSEQLVPEDQKKPTSTSREEINEPNDKKAVQMNCSCCKRSMMKGQTAYQKKGFTDVFCSKTCLFERLPASKAASRTCFYCFREISQPLDLIMAAVDLKGTMKDFCSVTCLCSFKSKPRIHQTRQSLPSNVATASTQTSSLYCRTCNNSCSTTLELKLGAAVHNFCSDVCLDAVGVCDVCSSTCREDPLTLRLEDGARTVCSAECLVEFKERIESTHPCTSCRSSLPVRSAVVHRSGQNVAELFCSGFCVSSHKVQLQLLNGSQSSGRAQRNSQAERTDHNYSSVAETDDVARLVSQMDYTKCCGCFEPIATGQNVYQLKRARKVFCSEACVTGTYPHVKFDTRKCYNCCQLITQPQKVILAPADDSGSLKELCSETCLTSVNSQRTSFRCQLCTKNCSRKFSVTVDGEVHRFCSDSCVARFNEENSWSTCETCGALCAEKRLALRTEDDVRTVCGDECLFGFKEKVETPQLCPTCRTPHQLSDMLENKNREGVLDFFCSHRCMKVHKAHTSPVSEKTSPSAEEDDVKDVKPSLLTLPQIKEEAIDEEYAQARSEPVSSRDVKEEPDELKQELRIGSVFSLTEVSKAAQMDSHESCSSCQRVLMDGETVYQRKAHTDLFCSTSCLLKFYQKPVKTTCHFCLQVITNPQDVLQAVVDTRGTKKDFCSKTCLSSFNYQRVVSTKLPLVPVASQSQCSICRRFCISKHEVTLQDVLHKICSDPCFHRFCTINSLSVCASCGSRCTKPLKTEDGDRPLCSADCLSRFKQKMQTLQPCTMCRSSKLASDMVENRNGKNGVELFCSKSCAMVSKIQTVCASGEALDCDNCRKTTAPVCHLAMCDASIRSFCSLTCAMDFKETQKDWTSNVGESGTQNQTQNDSDKASEELLCAQCLQAIQTSPQLVQNKKQLVYVCSSACSQDFKRINNIVGSCEHCQNKKLINEVKRINNKICCFCSDVCFRLFLHDLRRMWGKVCSSCSFCLSVSKAAAAAAQDEGAEEEFCSETCRSQHNLLLSHLLKCDSCGRRGRLSESLPLPGDVKRFCHLKCLLRFCRKQEQLVDAGSSPVLTDLVSLDHLDSTRSSPQLGLFTDIQTKVVGHASVQTDPTELKNKSTLCVPLVHNKGVSCSVQTAETASQTVVFKEKLLPVPVPVFVPLPMNMYSQYTPTPLPLPVPLPVPVLLSEKQSSSEPTEEEAQQTLSLLGNISSFRDEFETDLNNQKEVVSDSILNLFFESQPHKTPSNGSDRDLPEERLPDHPPPPPPSQQTVDEDHHKTKLTNGETAAEGAEEEPSNKGSPQMVPRKKKELSSQRGADAWRRWIQWRGSQTDTDLVSSPADLLECSPSELNLGLCLFIKEAKRQEGGPRSADAIFYLCLCIQQYLFENGRLENLFSDLTYQKFSSKMTKILKRFRSSVSAPGSVRSCVEEDFLWGCKQLGAYSPLVLLNTLLFFCCRRFGFTTVEQHRQLSFAFVIRCTKTNPDSTKTTYLRFYPPTSRNQEEPESDGVPAKKRRLNETFLKMKENKKNPLRCPVKLYEFYLSKCSESVRHRADLFYLQPRRRCRPSSPLWFSATPLDAATMEAMIVRTLAVRQKKN